MGMYNPEVIAHWFLLDQEIKNEGKDN